MRNFNIKPLKLGAMLLFAAAASIASPALAADTVLNFNSVCLPTDSMTTSQITEQGITGKTSSFSGILSWAKNSDANFDSVNGGCTIGTNSPTDALIFTLPQLATLKSVQYADIFNMGLARSIIFDLTLADNSLKSVILTTDSLVGAQLAIFDDVVSQISIRGQGTFDNLTFSSVSAAVPEPATWGMMIAGFAAIGATLRRRTFSTVRAA